MKMKYKISILLLIINSIASIASADTHTATGKIASHYYVLDSWGNNAPNLEIELPDNWEYKKVEGPDFDVHWLTAPKNMGTIGIYIGHHPNFKEPKDVAKIKRDVGNKEASFYPRKTKSTTSFDAVVEGFFWEFRGSGVEDLRLHIMIHEKKNGFAEKAFEYLKTLRVSKRDG